VRRLIVNADDLGADIGRTQGICEAIRAGAVTSASILANGPALAEALQAIRSLPPQHSSWGVHLNLSEGPALTAGLRLLTDEEGFFWGKARAHELLAQQASPALAREIDQELDAQILALKNAGLRIDHLDGHQHIHIFPAVIRVALGVARRHRIAWLRIPDEAGSPPASEGLPAPLMDEARMFIRLARAARSHLTASGLLAAEHFRGLYLKGRLSPLTMEMTLRHLPPGLTELMVHPGRFVAAATDGPFAAFSNPDRERELGALLEQGFAQALNRHDIRLTSFSEAAV